MMIEGIIKENKDYRRRELCVKSVYLSLSHKPIYLNTFPKILDTFITFLSCAPSLHLSRAKSVLNSERMVASEHTKPCNPKTH